MYGYLRETDDSTSINFSAYGKFLPGEKSGNQLVTVGAKYIRIFRTNPYVLIEPANDGDEWIQKTKLECMFSCRLLNKVLSFATARIPQCPGQDVFLMAFEQAKLSIVAVSERERNLQTISLHAFESEYLRDGFTKFYQDPIVRVDPSNRCAALLAYGKHIAILPFLENSKKVNSYIIPLRKIDQRLDNIVDLVFLDGYYEPTLLFLYEPLQTTSGRASVRHDTMCMMGVSVNLNDKQFAVVWQISSLPMDSYSLLSIPKPIGGAVVLGANDLIYLNQAVPPCGIILNSCFDNFTKFPLKDMKHLKLTLDCACMTWLEDGRLAIGSKEGDLYVLKLVTSAGSSGVKSLEIEKVFECSIAYSLTVCAPGHLFIGSRLGDSQLVEYSVTRTVKEGNEAKKPKTEKNNFDMDEDDMELYGAGLEEEENEEEDDVEEVIKFKLLDDLKNIGPIKSMCVGNAHSLSPVLSERTRVDPVFDIVTGSGHGKNGSLCVLQRSVRPDIITSSILEGAQQMWAVGRKDDESHRYLIVTRLRSTLVLELGEEMVELEEQLFVSGEPTVAAGELLQGALAVQVTSMCIALVTDGQQVQEVHIDSNFPVIMASIVDPYVALLTQNGRLLLYQLSSQPYIHLKEVNLSSTTFASTLHTTLTSISIYSDASGLMTCSSSRAEGQEDDKVDDTADATLYGEDDEDYLLYGEATTSQSKTSVTSSEGGSRKRKRLGHDAIQSSRGGEQSDALDPTKGFANVTYWLVLVHENGKLVIHSLPDMDVVFQIRKFGGVPEILSDVSAEDEEKDRRAKAALAATAVGDQAAEIVRPEEKVMEAQIVGLGINQAHPVLMAVIDEQVVMYEMFTVRNPIPDHLCISFRKLPHTAFLRSTSYVAPDGRRAPLELGYESERRYSIIHPFERISSVTNGVMIIGAMPTMVVYGTWGGLQTHELVIDGAIKAFTPFNNENVLHGFVYLTDKESELRIARLPTDVDYEMPYPCKKVEVGSTVHHIRYISSSDVYAVVTSVGKPSNKIWVVQNDDKHEETLTKDDNFVLPNIPNYALHLYSPQDWKEVPNTEVLFDTMEVVTACEDVALKSESTMSGLETLLAIGTVNNYGEEVLVRGRIILCEVIEVVPEPGQPTSNRKIKTVYDKEQKGPVTSLCSMNGLLLSGMGQKVFIWVYRDGDLQGLSFLDMHYYVNNLASLRSIALACDVEESVSLIRFQEEFKALSIASRDDRRSIQPPMAAQFIVDGPRLGFLLSDEAGNITMSGYLPDAVESIGGDRLVTRAAINIGTNINAFLRIKGHTSLLRTSTAEDVQAIAEQQTTLFASLDGSFGYIRPINEKSFRRLHFLQSFIGSATPQIAGLHPKGARAARPTQPIINGASHRHMVDGDVVEQFLYLSTPDKQDLARRLGASRYHIMDDIMHMRRMGFYF